PYRTETADLDVFWNPYVLSEPYGTIQFTTDSDDTDAASGEVASSAQGAGVEDNGYAETPDPQPEAVESGGNVVVPPPSPAAIVLTVSNAIDTTDLASQDRTNSFELVDDGPNSSSTVLGSVMALPGVAADAAVYVARDAAGNVDVELTTAWNSIKNIYAVSDQAADIAITNFVHADLDFGNGGDSHIVLDAVKRGFINTGDGDDVVDIKAFTNIDALSRRVDVKTGDGDDMVIYEGSSSYLGTSTVGLSELTFTAGAGTDTLKLTGPDQVFDLTTARFDLTGIEHFDISAAPNATLKLDANIVSTLVGSGLNELTGTADTLVVSGVAGDRLDLANGGSWSAAGTVGVAGESYTIYEHGSGVRIAADQDITLV
ncbi:MAG: hypothetical protein OEU46_23660, partial [Alphaproteobacteria bacterium]|nr:hypothetical protein [Alphaproteobacteria bacterium]